MVLYFSGTGNSKFIAESIADATEDTLFSLNDSIKQGEMGALATGSRLVLVTPTYAWRIPKAVRDWMRRTQLMGAEKIWFVMDCGSEIGNASQFNKRLAEEKGLQYMGTAQIVMPENYIAMFKTPSQEEAQAIVAKAMLDIDRAIGVIRTQRAFATTGINLFDRVKSSVVNPLFYINYVKAKDFTVGQGCVGCGLCEKLCPMNNIRIANGKPVWGSDCTHCMACISYCPKEAIEYGTHSVGLERYTFEKLK